MKSISPSCRTIVLREGGSMIRIPVERLPSLVFSPAGAVSCKARACSRHGCHLCPGRSAMRLPRPAAAPVLIKFSKSSTYFRALDIFPFPINIPVFPFTLTFFQRFLFRLSDPPPALFFSDVSYTFTLLFPSHKPSFSSPILPSPIHCQLSIPARAVSDWTASLTRSPLSSHKQISIIKIDICRPSYTPPDACAI